MTVIKFSLIVLSIVFSNITYSQQPTKGDTTKVVFYNFKQRQKIAEKIEQARLYKQMSDSLKVDVMLRDSIICESFNKIKQDDLTIKNLSQNYDSLNITSKDCVKSLSKEEEKIKKIRKWFKIVECVAVVELATLIIVIKLK